MAGLTLDELAARTGCGAGVLRTVLLEEVRRGRVSCENGRFALRPGALPPEVAAALRELSAPDASIAANDARPRRRDGRVHASERANLNFAVY